MLGISVQQICQDLKLEIIHKSSNEVIEISSSEINRPGLQLCGFYDYFDQDRVQIIGKAEWSYLSSLSKEQRQKRIEDFFSYYFPCLIVAWNLEIYDEMLEYAKKYDRNLFATPLHTTQVMNKMINYLNDKLAPNIKTHGVLVEVYGIGIFIIGASGVGKSETAMELVNRGHRLIADDLVEIKKLEDNRLIGSAPEMLKHFIELRGVGIVDVKTLYGVGAVKNAVDIKMVIELEEWKEGKYYDRLGIDTEFTEILGVSLPKVTIPVMPGRNLSIIVETAARNHREKIMGYNAAKVFVDKVYQMTTHNSDKKENEEE
ncbi:HPr(Ser) kinase/phosphatase [Garciella nitratireducens]|uniref:HPr kinase/phosphorylase n=1 Tax=Garciella nitratireducens DSM 15102 TaxID=1121911 RepID=A0A1T4NR51_9FIRM|nr:HPr(Ser) kinase/phosphatase [Garciella nitratireducens]SJZ81703.1 Hpr(Ser) kinase/phosphatase [Garciella nitratireducens DSM 15102]